ncbi:BsuBI/PstI family type II restriction endonuclease [Curtobacterium sp. MCPF17_031]|uniref:BsuBI/PstI family type II restriction endonuclease n=1 Tax=Curtobacterium sp. MCPF17_031 TaxID=2175653 RepID=UPI000DA70B9A|nr:BsuBI/PstI family type II restriction endonuclease [Curtobacterium sp. MCPF17_031]PZE34248.1 restriction endonuclease [Curtobacterium sp. MCPF17_031]
MLLPVVSVVESQRRLALIFPRTNFDAAVNSPLAAAAVAGLVYAGAVYDEDAAPDGQRWGRPSMVTWLNDDIMTRDAPAERDAWYQAAMEASARRAVETLLSRWGASTERRYADNTRETLRDETFRKWRTYGAAIKRTDLPTTSPLPRWALAKPFAELFTPSEDDADLHRRIDSWRDNHASQAGRLRALAAQAHARAATGAGVDVRLPNGQTRSLEPGVASNILKGVVEEWATRKLDSPLVLTISEPGDKLYVADGELLRSIGVRIDTSNLLPDALIADARTDSEAVHFWMIEAVATDGPIDDERKARLTAWAGAQGIPPQYCRFLTAFASRNAPAARKRLKDLADGTAAWYLDEPDSELNWAPITNG